MNRRIKRFVAEPKEFNLSWIMSGAAVNLSSQVVIMGLNFLQGIFLARLIGAEGCGAVSLITVSFIFPTTLFSFSLGMAAQRFLPKRPDQADAIHSFMVVYSLSVGALLLTAFYLLRGILSHLVFSGSEGEHFFLLALPMLPAFVLNTFLPRALISSDKVVSKNMVQVARVVVYMGLTWFLVVVQKKGTAGAVTALTLATVFEALSQLAMLFRGRRFTWIWDRSLIKDMFHFGLNYHGTSVLTLVFKRIEYFFISYFMGVGAVGVYSVANSLIEFLLTVARSMQDLIITAFSANDAKKTANMAARLSRCLLLGSVPMVLVAAFLGPWVIPAFYGAAFHGAIVPFWILLLNVLMFGPGPYLTTYVSIDHPGIGALTTVAVTALNVVFTVVLIPLWGLSGNATATIIGYGLNVLLGLGLFQKYSGLSWKTAVVPQREDIQKAWAMARAKLLP